LCSADTVEGPKAPAVRLTTVSTSEKYELLPRTALSLSARELPAPESGAGDTNPKKWFRRRSGVTAYRDR